MRERFREAQTFQEFLQGVEANRSLWHQIYQRARPPKELLASWEELRGQWHFLVLAEDWCGDVVNTIPYLARVVEATAKLDLRLLSRDENPDLMDAHLSGPTGASRAIPVVMILDRGFQEVAWWGSRPGPLQELFEAELRALPKEQRQTRLRAWYARDKGRTTLKEIAERIPHLS